MANEEMLESWSDGVARHAIVEFVDAVTRDGPDHVAPEERVAVFDNDGTLWTEKPMPTQLHFIVKKWREQAAADPSLADKQPHKGAVTGDFGWLSAAIDKHYAGDDSDLKVIVPAILSITADRTVDDYAGEIADFYENETHLVLDRPYRGVVYEPRTGSSPTSSPAADGTSCGR
jgi:hypothetical protein